MTEEQINIISQAFEIIADGWSNNYVSAKSIANVLMAMRNSNIPEQLINSFINNLYE